MTVRPTLLVLTMLLASCGGDGGEQAHVVAPSTHDAETAVAHVVRLTPEQLSDAGIEIAAAGPGRIDRGIELLGEVRPNGDRAGAHRAALSRHRARRAPKRRRRRARRRRAGDDREQRQPRAVRDEDALDGTIIDKRPDPRRGRRPRRSRPSSSPTSRPSGSTSPSTRRISDRVGSARRPRVAVGPRRRRRGPHLLHHAGRRPGDAHRDRARRPAEPRSRVAARPVRHRPHPRPVDAAVAVPPRRGADRRRPPSVFVERRRRLRAPAASCSDAAAELVGSKCSRSRRRRALRRRQVASS